MIESSSAGVVLPGCGGHFGFGRVEPAAELTDGGGANAEGLTLFGEDGGSSGHGIEFSERNVTRLLENEPMAAPGAACLALAWRNRIALLGR